MVQYTLKLKERKTVADGTELFIFEKPVDFTFEAGQYVVLMLPKLAAPDVRGPVRSFSICSAPFESDICFAMRHGESGFKQAFFQLKPGSTITATSPIGHFTLSHASDDKPIIFLVGGIGITPVRSILKQVEHDKVTRDFTVFYSNRFAKDAAFHAELALLKLPGLHYITTLSSETTPCTTPNEERGFICEEMLRKYIPTLEDAWYYVVGGSEFVAAMEKMLTQMGIAKERQVCDPFVGLTRGVEKK